MRIDDKEYSKELIVNKIYCKFQQRFYSQVNFINRKYIADYIQDIEIGTIYKKIIESKMTHHR